MAKQRYVRFPINREEKPMDNEELDHLGSLYEAIGQELIRIVGNGSKKIFYYAEAGEGWVDQSIYEVNADSLDWFYASQELTDLLFEAWAADEPSKRWSTMEYELEGTRFTTRFRFPDEVNVEETSMARRDEVLRRRFGNKPENYPPL